MFAEGRNSPGEKRENSGPCTGRVSQYGPFSTYRRSSLCQAMATALCYESTLMPTTPSKSLENQKAHHSPAGHSESTEFIVFVYVKKGKINIL